MQISSLSKRPVLKPAAPRKQQAEAQRTDTFQPGKDRVTLTQKLGKIARGALIGAGIGALATGIGFVGALSGGTGALLGIAGTAALGIGLAHKLDMMVPSTFTSPAHAKGEKTFYGATAGLIGGAFGATMAGLGMMTGGGAVVAAAVGIGYASALSATRNVIMGVGEQFPNAL